MGTIIKILKEILEGMILAITIFGSSNDGSDDSEE